ncbi:MAG: hypothetical protein KDB00_16005, partial [Planctomycetales bacterium]|nr:hypothetical protein [Planctomycetales bacterium]
ALVGDLVLLPALLAGPLGKFFRPRVGSNADRGDLSEALAVVGPGGAHVKVASTPDPDPSGDEPDPIVDRESLPNLKLHSPSRRTDRSHRMKGR